MDPHIEIREAGQKLAREDMLARGEVMEIPEACGGNHRDRALISFHMEAGTGAGETPNAGIGHVEFLDNGGAVADVGGKAGDRPIHVLHCVPTSPTG